MIFKDNIFEKVCVDDMYKSQMQDRFSDKTMPDFCPLSISSTLKDEYKKDGFEKEYIDSYLKAAKILANDAMKTCHPTNDCGILMVFSKNNVTIPMLYMVRHTLELSIKYAIECIGGNPKDVHGLIKLWNSFCSYLPKNISGKDRSFLKKMYKFLECINSLDATGTKLRYSEDENGYTQGDFMWINPRTIVDNAEKFIKQLYLLDIEEIKCRKQNDAKVGDEND